MSSLKNTNIIKHVSFLLSGQRQIVEADERGTFRVPVKSVVEGRSRTTYKNLTASELIAHPEIMNADPVITLKTGEKIRVFDGGDPRYLPAMSQGLIEKHDRVETLRRKFEKRKQQLREKNKKREEKKTPVITPFYPYLGGSSTKSQNDTDEYDNPFYMDDDDYF